MILFADSDGPDQTAQAMLEIGTLLQNVTLSKLFFFPLKRDHSKVSVSLKQETNTTEKKYISKSRF